MSQAGVITINITPAGNVTNLISNNGTVVAPDIAGAIGVIGHNSAYTIGLPGSHILEIVASSSYLVDATGNAPFSTIGAAVLQAVSDGVSTTNQANIVVKPGVYAGNITLSTGGINIIAWDRQNTEPYYTPNSSINRPSVIITGGVTTSVQCKFIGIGFQPTTGTNVFTCTAGAIIGLSQCKIEPFNAAVFSATANITIYIDNCNISTQDTSTTDKLFTGSGVGFYNFYLQSTYINLTTPTSAVPCNFYATNCTLDTNFDFTGVTSTCYFRLQGCYVNSGSINPFINSPAGNVLQFDFYSSTFLSLAIISGLIVASNAASFAHFFNCTLYNQTVFSGFNDIIYQATSILNPTSGTWTFYNSQFTDFVDVVLQNTNSGTVRDSIIVGTGALNASFVIATAATRGYATGIIPGSSNILRMTSAATDNFNVQSGTTIWTIDPTNNLTTTYAEPLISPGGQPVVSTAAVTYNALITDSFIAADPTLNAITVNLPSAPTPGSSWIVKDATGKSATHAITITSVSGLTPIDGGITDTININFVARRYTYVNNTLGYMIN